MDSKKKFSTELAYLLATVILAMGTAFMARADFGMSTIAAPVYLIYIKLSKSLTWLTFGMTEYCFQAIILILLSIAVRGFKLTYLFSFFTAVFYGFTLDGCTFLVSFLPCGNMLLRIVFYILGLLLIAIAVSLYFHSYIAPAAYELFVKEVALKYNKKMHNVKIVYDISSCVFTIVLSFIFFGFGHFEAVKIGTVISAILNGFLIGKVTEFLESRFTFYDCLRKNK